MFLVHLVFSLGSQVYSSIWAVYTKYRFVWSPAAVGASISLIGILVAFAQGSLVRIFTARWSERFTLLTPSSAGAPFIMAATFSLIAVLLLPGLRSLRDADRKADLRSDGEPA